jgi:hypothetical protein
LLKLYQIRRQLLGAGAAVALMVGTVLVGYRYGITLWDWIKLLIVPAVIAGGGLWFNRQQRERETEIAEQRAQDEALQAYLDQMSTLLLEKNLRSSEEASEVRTLARARTLTVLRRLDGERQGRVLQFLHESRVIDKENLVLDLRGADLRGAYLRHADLSGANLFGANLFGAVGLTNEMLDQQAKSLEGATMPNGHRYEVWLESKGSGEDGENQ